MSAASFTSVRDLGRRLRATRRTTRIAAGLIAAASIVSIGCGTNLQAGQHYDNKATVWMLGADKVPYRITVELFAAGYAEAAGQAESDDVGALVEEAVVWIAKCPKYKCQSTTPFVFDYVTQNTDDPKQAGYDSSDSKNITMRVPGWGGMLSVAWKSGGAPGPVDVPTVTASHDVDGSTTWKATATVSFLGTTCTDPNATVTRHTTVSILGVNEPSGRKVPLNPPPGTPKSPRCTSPR